MVYKIFLSAASRNAANLNSMCPTEGAAQATFIPHLPADTNLDRKLFANDRLVLEEGERCHVNHRHH